MNHAKRAFTLIELLVVIAIIAILAAILFPVLSQARVAAKKSNSISNQKQIALGVVMYCTDSDDVYPRNDDCQLNSSLNSALNNKPGGTDPTPYCSGAQGFPFRMNHFSWQKWIMPYVKNVDIFIQPGRGRLNTTTASCPTGQWTQCGQITGSYMINAALTGALNTWNRSLTAGGRFRESWLGGSQGAVPNSAGAMIIMEFGNPNLGAIPSTSMNPSSDVTQTHYPVAYREIWANELLKNGGNGGENYDVNPLRAYADGVTVGYVDGHAKFLTAKAFLAATPRIAEYSPGTANGFFTGGFYPNGGTINTNIDYPLWSLGQ